MNVNDGISLFLTITGLCGFVPIDDDSPYMEAVCVDAEHPGGVRHHDTPHVAGLLVPKSSISDDSDWSASDFIENDEYKFYWTRGMRAWFIGWENGNLEVFRCPGVVGKDCPDNTNEVPCFDWVVPAKRILTRNLRDLAGDVSPRLVSSVFELRAGRLSTKHLGHGEEETDGPPIWLIDRSINPNADYVRAIAESVVLFRELPDETDVTLCFCGLGTPSVPSCESPCKKLVLIPGDEGVIDISLKNQPRGWLFETTAEPHEDDDDNPHFAHLFRLLAGRLFEPSPKVVGFCDPVAEAPPVAPWIDIVREYAAETSDNPQCPGMDFGGP